MPFNVNTMLIGAGDAGLELLKDILRHPEHPVKVVCIIDDDPAKQGKILCGVPVIGTREAIPAGVARYGVENIILAMPSVDARSKQEILGYCQRTRCTLKTLPPLSRFVVPDAQIDLVRSVDINDLLGREPSTIDLSSISRHLEGKTVLVTGGGGSIGGELCRQLAAYPLNELLIFDIYENNLYEVQQELRAHHPRLSMRPLIGSIRDKARLESVFARHHPDIVFHAAAHKHVPLMEANPHEAIKNNVLGTLNLAEAAVNHGVDNFLLISTDKAVNPTNIMGATKRICERIVLMFNRRHATRFAAVRFGNVLGSNGSVIPLFQKQIAEGGPVTVTHPEITRFFMTIPEAVSLVLAAESSACGGEIFVLDMGEPVKIVDMARQLIRLSGYEPDRDISIVFTGLRPGEKLYEEILTNEEGLHKTGNDKILVVTPTDFDDAALELRLQELAGLAADESSDIHAALSAILPTFHPWEGGRAH
ncbi:MAG: polysaccharide biosynthesis protein [Desulfovibrio desulfuricans]|nr:polysaccharide biosynthesis protein [Desulfovibrio desulfuricans]